MSCAEPLHGKLDTLHLRQISIRHWVLVHEHRDLFAFSRNTAYDLQSGKDDALLVGTEI